MTDRIRLAAIATVVIGCCATTSCATGAAPAPAPPTPGATMPAITAQSIDRHPISSADRPLVLSFLTLDPAGEPGSRSQLTVLKSMARQYRDHGLTVVVADTSGRSAEDLTNAAHDWNLFDSGVLVLSAPDAAQLASTYRPTVPDTVLLAPDGSIQHRWQGTVAASQHLALPIQEMLTPP